MTETEPANELVPVAAAEIEYQRGCLTLPGTARDADHELERGSVIEIRSESQTVPELQIAQGLG